MSGFHFSSVNHALVSENPSDSINLFWNQQMEKNRANAISFFTPKMNGTSVSNVSVDSRFSFGSIKLTIFSNSSLSTGQRQSQCHFNGLMKSSNCIIAKLSELTLLEENNTLHPLNTPSTNDTV